MFDKIRSLFRKEEANLGHVKKFYDRMRKQDVELY